MALIECKLTRLLFSFVIYPFWFHTLTLHCQFLHCKKCNIYLYAFHVELYDCALLILPSWLHLMHFMSSVLPKDVCDCRRWRKQSEHIYFVLWAAGNPSNQVLLCNRGKCPESPEEQHLLSPCLTFSPPPLLLALPPSLPLALPWIFLLADLYCISHCRAPRRAQTASDKVRTGLILFVESEPGIWNYAAPTMLFFKCDVNSWSLHWRESKAKIQRVELLWTKNKQSKNYITIFNKVERCGEGRSPETCHGWPSTGEVCRSSLQLLTVPLCRWQYGDSPGVAPARAAPRPDIWARSSLHSQLFWTWALRPCVCLRCLTPHLSFTLGTLGECSFSQLSYSLVRLFILSFFLTFPHFYPVTGNAVSLLLPPSDTTRAQTNRLCISPEGDSVELLLHRWAPPPHGLQICAPSRVAGTVLQIHKWP